MHDIPNAPNPLASLSRVHMGAVNSHVDATATNSAPLSNSLRPSSFPSVSARPTFLSYFLALSTPEMTHSHIPPAFAEIDLVACILASLRLPSELVTRVLEEAEYWHSCRLTSRKSLSVPSDVMPRESPTSWSNGQEEQLQWEMEVEGTGLKDRKGEVWYLVSPPIGCTGQPTSTQDEEIKMVTFDKGVCREGGQGWLRRVVLETVSKDQGWSSGQAEHYGEPRGHQALEAHPFDRSLVLDDS